MLEWPFFEQRHRDLAWRGPERHARRRSTSGAARSCAAGRRLAGAHGRAAARRAHALPRARDPRATTTRSRTSRSPCRGSAPGRSRCSATTRCEQRYLPGRRGGREDRRVRALRARGRVATSPRWRRSRAGNRISGVKTWISNGGIADFYTVFARATARASAPTSSTPSTSRSSSASTSSRRTRSRRCASTTRRRRRSARPGKGMRVALGTLDVFRSTVGAAALGFARRAMDEALARVKERQAVRRADGRAPARSRPSSPTWRWGSTPARCSSTARRGRRTAAPSASPARRRWPSCTPPRRRSSVIDAAVQIFGGLGVTSGQVVERLYREIRALRIYEGASEVQQLVIAREVLRG